ncbi:glycoside hydrolase family 19 protein [Candidatus Dojkabacteria bacterium]|jgi:putative chitinase|nr:glycoside hydrolase family 19 protein [Candidatus Dojkabacteria bacterium]
MNYLIQYQKSHNLTPDGVVGPGTAKVMMEELGIQSKIAFCHFIAQIQHESGSFTAGRENLNYSADALSKLFGKYFKTISPNTVARQPEKIANIIYANRMGNGNISSGDGWKYRGNAGLQLTGRANHELFFKSVGLPLDTDPNVILTPEYYFSSAKFFFDTNHLWQYCGDKSNACILKISKAINLGSVNAKGTPIGLEAREQLTHTLFAKLC